MSAIRAERDYVIHEDFMKVNYVIQLQVYYQQFLAVHFSLKLCQLVCDNYYFLKLLRLFVN